MESIGAAYGHHRGSVGLDLREGELATEIGAEPLAIGGEGEPPSRECGSIPRVESQGGPQCACVLRRKARPVVAGEHVFEGVSRHNIRDIAQHGATPQTCTVGSKL